MTITFPSVFPKLSGDFIDKWQQQQQGNNDTNNNAKQWNNNVKCQWQCNKPNNNDRGYSWSSGGLNRYLQVFHSNIYLNLQLGQLLIFVSPTSSLSCLGFLRILFISFLFLVYQNWQCASNGNDYCVATMAKGMLYPIIVVLLTFQQPTSRPLDLSKTDNDLTWPQWQQQQPDNDNNNLTTMTMTTTW